MRLHHKEDDYALWLEEDTEDVTDLGDVIPQMRRSARAAPPEEDLGIRRLLERPDALSRRWRRSEGLSRAA